MKFLLDENISKSLAQFLAQHGHTVLRIKEIDPGAEDFQVLELAIEKDAILVTLDKDFGELIFKEGKLHKGIIFLRLDDQTPNNTQRALSWFLSTYPNHKVIDNFAVITQIDSRFRARFR